MRDKKTFDDDARLLELVDKVMKDRKPIRKFTAEDYDAYDIARILSILQERMDWAAKEHPGENLENVLGKDVVDQYTTFRELAAMKGISIPTATNP